MKSMRWMILIALALAAGAIAAPIQAAEPSANDLVAMVNGYRAASGYYTMNPHSLVFQAAQTHAEWIVATGQGGHIGAGGSDETMRVSWTGYGGGASIQCDENWASGRTIEDAVYGAWSDWVHQEVMLNQWGNRYTDIGGGVAAWGDGSYVMILNVCKVVGQEASGDAPTQPPTSGTPGVVPTRDLSNYIYGVMTATPQFDGAVTHVVQYGQTLLTIAQAYGIKVEELRTLNGFAPDFTAIWPDDELIIRKGSGETAPTATTQTTPTPTATLTPRPTYTPSNLELTATVLAASATAEAETESAPSTLTAGMLLLVLAGLGLVMVVFVTTGKQDRTSPNEKRD